MGGALEGLRVIEFLGIGPGPFAAMMLADHGAQVIRVARPGPAQYPTAFDRTAFDRYDVFARSRRLVRIDLKTEDGRAIVRDLCQTADGVIEGYRPGVMERLGLGPEVLLADNPRLAYGRVTGWGQQGPLAAAAGHDINYIALNGVLHSIGREGEAPVPPFNFIGDFGGGGMLLAFGMVTAMLAVARGKPGQIVDAAMLDGSALLAGMATQMIQGGLWDGETGTHMLSGAAPFYDTYACADGKYIAIGALEPAFYAMFRRALGIADDPLFDAQMDRSRWREGKARVATIFATKTRAEWCTIMEGTDMCFAPVLNFTEVQDHPQIRARGTFVQVDGAVQPAPAPRFSATPAEAPRGAVQGDDETGQVLQEMGYSQDRIAMLKVSGAIG